MLVHHKRRSTRSAGKDARPSGGRIPAPGRALRPLPDALHRAADRAYSRGWNAPSNVPVWSEKALFIKLPTAFMDAFSILGLTILAY